jgi:hypothetical protein
MIYETKFGFAKACGLVAVTYYSHASSHIRVRAHCPPALWQPEPQSTLQNVVADAQKSRDRHQPMQLPKKKDVSTFALMSRRVVSASVCASHLHVVRFKDFCGWHTHPYSTVVEKAASALTASKDMYTFHVLDLTTPLPLSNIIEKSFNFIFIT